MRSLVFLHGFLGEPSDWQAVIENLRQDFHCRAIDLNVLNPLEHAKELLEKQRSPFFLVGYSMGGRIAWQLAPHLPFLRGLILLGAHPGLNGDKEKKERMENDRYWISVLEAGDMSAFLHLWYAQPLFATLRKKEEVIATRMSRNPHILRSVMRSMSLAEQPCLTVFSPTLFLHGAEDLKYAALYSDLPHVEAIPNAGHAAHIENPIAVAGAIRHFAEKYE